MEAVTDFRTLIAYFRELATGDTSLKALKKFKHGGTERILQSTQGDIEYPCLFLEWPSFPIKDNGAENYTADMQFAIAVISACPTDNYDIQDEAMAENYIILMDIISRMIEDRRAEVILFNYNINDQVIDPITGMNSDNCFGWRMEIKLNNNIDVFYDASKWNS